MLLAGSRLCGPTADCATAGGEIDLGIGLPATRANVVDYADTRIALVVPSLAALGTTQIILTVDEQASNALGFEVLP